MTSTSTDRREGLNSSLAIKVPVAALATTNITLSGEQTIDGVACVTGNRVVAAGQTSSVNNGIYIVDTGTWSRALDADASNDLTYGTLVKVNGGTANAGFWYVSTTGTIIPGTSAINFGQASTALAVVSAFMQTVLDDTTAAAAAATLGVLPLAGGTMTGSIALSLASQDFSWLRGYISGMVLSTAGASTTMTASAGAAVDDGNTTLMKLAASISKTTSAWAVGSGNGGKLEAAAIANNTWYHFFEIMRPDTGVVDVGFSTSATAPTMPNAAYTKKRRIGSGLTNGSAQWTAFVADELAGGRVHFQWLVPAADIGAAPPASTAAITRTMTTPLGVRVEGVFDGGYALDATFNASGQALMSDLSQSDNAPGIGDAQLNVGAAAIGGSGTSAQFRVWTNTSSQIRSRVTANGTNSQLYIRTQGWIDGRTV